MGTPGLLGEYLTEFDDRISSELNLDPLGLQAIWSSYGQAIFQNRISSISNDVRNYTLNLFNHRLTKALVEDESVVLGRGLNRQSYSGKKDSQAFKQACLIHLENLFTFAMAAAEAEGREAVEATGVLGIGIARREWAAQKRSVKLIFSHQAKSHLLSRQASLGVSGRYKTPLVQMEFFNSAYDYSRPASAPVWKRADEQLFSSTPLAALMKLAHGYMKALLSEVDPEPTRTFDKVPPRLLSAFVAAFRTPQAVGGYSREFWLAVTGLDQGSRGALYQVLEDESSSPRDVLLQTEQVFRAAIKRKPLADDEKAKLRYVLKLEPFLAELDLLLQLMLSAKAQTLDEVATRWSALGRTERTLNERATIVDNTPGLMKQAVGTPAERLQTLLRIAHEPNTKEQARKLLDYHSKIMRVRGQSPWLRLVAGGKLKVDVRRRDATDADTRPVGAWVHHYYIPQFRQLLSGLRGSA